MLCRGSSRKRRRPLPDDPELQCSASSFLLNAGGPLPFPLEVKLPRPARGWRHRPLNSQLVGVLLRARSQFLVKHLLRRHIFQADVAEKLIDLYILTGGSELVPQGPLWLEGRPGHHAAAAPEGLGGVISHPPPERGPYLMLSSGALPSSLHHEVRRPDSEQYL